MSPARPGDTQEEPFCPYTLGSDRRAHRCTRACRQHGQLLQHPPPEVSGTLRLARRGPERTRGRHGFYVGKGAQRGVAGVGSKVGVWPLPSRS